jgi:hypothetical protein
MDKHKVETTNNIIQQYYDRYVKGIDYSTILVTLLTFFVFVAQPLFLPSMSLSTFLELGFYGNVITRTALLVIIQKTYQRFARKNQLDSAEYAEVKKKLISSKDKVEASNLAYSLEHFAAKRSLEERCYGLKGSYDIEINNRKTTIERKKFLFERKQTLLHLLASIQNDDLDLDLYAEFADELSNFRHLDVDSAQLFVSAAAPTLPDNKYQVDVAKEESRNIMSSIRNSLGITFITTALIFTRNSEVGFFIDMLIMLTLMATNIVMGTYRGLEIYMKIYAADTQKELLLSSFFGAIAQKGSIPDVYEIAYQKKIAKQPKEEEVKLQVVVPDKLEYIDRPWNWAQEKMEEPHQPLEGQVRFDI